MKCIMKYNDIYNESFLGNAVQTDGIESSGLTDQSPPIHCFIIT